MISPEVIREKAARKYRDALRAQVRGELDALFPMAIRGDRAVGAQLAEAARAVEQLRAGSKAARGFGYEIEWEERRSRQFGRNLFPRRILIPTGEDFFKLLGKQTEFRRFVARVTALRERFPELEPWLEKNVLRVTRAEPDWDGLVEVLAYFREHPAPGVFARELPLRVDSKFIERHQGELRPLLEAILPRSAIDADETDFDRRFGLRPFEALIRMRFLDPELQRAAAVGQEEFGVPVDQLRTVSWPVRRVVIVENARCLLTLPPHPGSGALGLFGHGYRVSNFRRLDWLADCEILYWGDIDAQGFEILSLLRERFPSVKSLAMDRATFAEFQPLCGSGTPARNQAPRHLTEEERDLCDLCRARNLRLEQERIPPAWVRLSG
ncbi:DUF3322 and DUF2220 domain-containing protein [soil metagenome]